MYRVEIVLTAADGHGAVSALAGLKRLMLADLTGHHGLLDVTYGISGPGVFGLTCRVVEGGLAAGGEYLAGEEG